MEINRGLGARLMYAVAVLVVAMSAAANAQEYVHSSEYSFEHGPKNSPKPKRPIIISEQSLQSLKAYYENGEYSEFFNYIFNKADRLVSLAPLTVTSNPSEAASGNNNDYFSVGPYWWPDPRMSDGLPWIRRDGQVNMAVRGNQTDSKLFATLASRLEILSQAYYFSGNAKYVEASELLIDTWFIKPETAMTPHLNFAQSIPGRTDGRGIGIIEVRHFVHILNALTLLQQDFSESTNVAFGQWLSSFLDWLIESPNGKDEATMHNNHGTFYDVIVTSIAVYLGLDDLAQSTIAQSAQRTSMQIDSTGKQTHELARTKPFHYSLFNLMAYGAQVKLASAIRLSFPEQFPQASQDIVRAVNFQLNNIENKTYWPGVQEKSLPVEDLLALAMLFKSNPDFGHDIIIPETVFTNYALAKHAKAICAFWLDANPQFIASGEIEPAQCIAID